ncbi:methyltransferase domain-containing protein [Halalkalicoccus subterraneus]|uniref:methyltransferase domain-containing protein n=1 Tax=Halalkalicoccus subterraneus TaxID=2675002 RepID=UPI000EFC0BD4|nr:methyltransferase domain-containing protein [Halalkalicoccus subterraneus]
MRYSLDDHPAVFDALYAGKSYDEEVAFALERVPGADRALVVGCRTGEQLLRFEAAGLDVLGSDPSPAMVERARGKVEATVHIGALPDLPVEAEFNLVVAFGVVNRLAADELEASLTALADFVGEDGVLILDAGTFPEMVAPALRTGSGSKGDCARLSQCSRIDDRRARVDALVFHGESWFVERHTLTEFAHEEIAIALTDLGFVVKREDWDADPADMGDRSVFVARR